MRKYHPVIDEISDARTLAERVPRLRERFDGLVDIRDVTSEVYRPFKSNEGEGARRIASIPEALLGRILEIEPDLLLDRLKFEAWLAAHPEYRTTPKPARTSR